MLVERLTFQAKYGQGDMLVSLFKAEMKRFRDMGGGPARIYTDATGRMFTVQVEQEFKDLSDYAAFSAKARDFYGTDDFRGWFAKMTDAVETGERQLLAAEPV
jgi:hypothetical protein